MSSRRWYRSLYWRVALGLFAFLALMLAAEGALFLWITDRIAGSMPARSPRRLAVLVASDVGTALARDSSLDLDEYLREQYSHVFQTFFVVLRDGRVASNHDDVPEEIMAALRGEAEFAAVGGRGIGGRRARGRGEPPPDRPPPDIDRLFREGETRPDSGPPRRPFPGDSLVPRREFAPIVVNGAQIGRVGVLTTNPPFSRIVRQLGPTMGIVAGGVLLVGTALIAFIVFGPTRRRLKEVQSATERLGSGDLAARAPAGGGDEVAALATSFNRMADELASRARALESSDKARRQLLADVSHELMTPLTAMRGYIETLTMAEVQLEPATRQRYMRIITEETHRLEQIIGDLLDLARLEGGGMTLRRERVDLSALFTRVAARHEREMTERDVLLVTRIDSAAAIVRGDPDRLEQALQNLAANALRHTPDGGEIHLTADPVPAGIAIVVRDTGPGIAAEHLPLIFDRFYKADASRKAAGGSGLGLSIVKEIVERHGGTITARNDNGAVFEIVLPSPARDTPQK
jgi:two-component system, OmpR family, sensor kinase